MTFSKMSARTSTPKGATKGTPRSVPANHQALGETVKSQRITIAYLAEQQAALSGQMTALVSTVSDLTAIVRSVLPTVVHAQQAARQQQQQAAPVAPAAPAAPVAAPPVDRNAQRLANLAKGRATRAANVAARKAAAQQSQKAPESAQPEAVLVASASTDKAARRAAWKAAHGQQVKLERVLRTGKQAGVAYVGKTASAAYVVAWNRTTKVWDWSLQNGRGTKPVMGSNADRAAAFAGLNAAARKAKVSEVRA